MADPPRITRISYAPVKGMRILPLEQTHLTRNGIPGDRAFYLVDERRRMVNAKRFGALLKIVPAYDPDGGTLRLLFPDGSVCEGPVVTGESRTFTFFGGQVQAKPVAGPFSAEVSRFVGTDLRLVARPEDRPAVDRGAVAGVTLLGSASIRRLEEVADAASDRGDVSATAGGIDHRRFRMTIELGTAEPYVEDGWIGRRLKAGGAVLHVNGHVGRCAVTTRDPESAERNLPVLGLLRASRSDVKSEESLPFGVFASVVQPGNIRIGNPVLPL